MMVPSSHYSKIALSLCAGHSAGGLSLDFTGSQRPDDTMTLKNHLSIFICRIIVPLYGLIIEKDSAGSAMETLKPHEYKAQKGSTTISTRPTLRHYVSVPPGIMSSGVRQAA